MPPGLAGQSNVVGASDVAYRPQFGNACLRPSGHQVHLTSSIMLCIAAQEYVLLSSMGFIYRKACV